MTEPVRAVIVDDERAARDAVRSMLVERPQVQIVAEASNGREAEAILRQVRPDLVFLDVQMPDLDGFGVLDALGPAGPRGVVFVTAYDEHAIRAFEVHALDYVLKPFGRQRFNAAVTQALDRLRALDALTLQRTLSSMAQDRSAGKQLPAEVTGGLGDPSSRTPRRLAVRVGSKVTLVDIDAIDWMEARGDYVRVHAGKHLHVVAQRMHALERSFESSGFLRIHRSLIVNGSRVHELHRHADGSGTAVLRDGVRLRVARERWEALYKALSLADQ
jgi:two-component system LytT family response regulator